MECCAVRSPPPAPPVRVYAERMYVRQSRGAGVVGAGVELRRHPTAADRGPIVHCRAAGVLSDEFGRMRNRTVIVYDLGLAQTQVQYPLSPLLPLLPLLFPRALCTLLPYS